MYLPSRMARMALHSDELDLLISLELCYASTSRCPATVSYQNKRKANCWLDSVPASVRCTFDAFIRSEADLNPATNSNNFTQNIEMNYVVVSKGLIQFRLISLLLLLLLLYYFDYELTVDEVGCCIFKRIRKIFGE